MFRSTATFDRLLERATSNLLLEPDWNAILALCDSIRSGDTPPKYAVSAIKKKFYHENPHVVYYGLTVLESCVKNCGSLIHDEVATKAFMEELRELLKHTSDEKSKNKILEMVQTWGMAFRNSPKYRIVTETLNLMKAEGWKFPAVREAEAMFEADTAPDWAEGDVCHRCRVAFGMMTRQHHCRACGQVFCGKCSSKSCVLPKFGIEREVRVCDSCFDLYGPKDDSANSSPTRRPQHQHRKRPENQQSEGDLPAEYLASPLSKQSQEPPPKSGKSEEELKEEEELQLAIALSQSEAEEKEKTKLRSTSQILSGQSSGQGSSPAKTSTKKTNPDELDPELVRYLDRDYWEQKEKEKAEAKAKKASGGDIEVKPTTKVKTATTEVDKGTSNTMVLNKMTPPALAAVSNDEDLDEFVTTLRTQVEIFVNRMKSNSSRGRSIANDSSVQTLFMNTMAMHSKLLKHIQDQEDKRVYYEGLQDKIAQVKDARAALDALREEERERKRREAEEAERLRQIQMREKLEVMRQKKQEYLQYQRQLALQRMQEQEREMMLRQEQVKQQYYQPPHPGMYGQPPMGYPPMPPGTQYPGPPGVPPGAYPGYPAMAPPPPGGAMPPQAGAPPPPSPGAPMTPGAPPPGQMGMPPSTTTAPSDPGNFNMQGMNAALPQGGPPPPGAPGAPNPNPGAPPMPPQGYPGMAYPMPPGAPGAPPVMPGQPDQQQVPPPQQLQQPPQQQAPPPGSASADLAALISFD